MAKKTARELRKRRHQRIRKKVSGSPARPRLCVFRSNIHIYAQVIDDVAGHTLVAASSVGKPERGEMDEKTKLEQARTVGKVVAERALEAGITQVIFDRGGFLYHGRVQALAEAAREAGLEF